MGSGRDASAIGRRVALGVLPGAFAISRGAPATPLPPLDAHTPFLTVTRTADELSIVAADSIVADGFARESGWRCLKVAGPLAFDQIGIVAALSAPLAAAGISIFVVSTYDTDYLLVKEAALDDAIAALTAAGHTVSR